MLGGGVTNVPPAAPLSPGWTGRTCPTRAAWSTSGTCVTSSGSPPTPKTPGSAGRPVTGSWATCGAARTPRRRLGPPHPNPHPSPLSIHPSSLGAHPLFFRPRCPTWRCGTSCRRTRASPNRGRRSTSRASCHHWGGSLGYFWGFSSSLTPFCVPTACGSLTRTLDSGIGTFPPPDYGGVPTKSTPKPRGRPEPLPGAVPGRPAALTKVPRKARTLEREVPSVEELLVPGKHRGTGAPCRAAGPPGAHSHRGCPQGACPTWVTCGRGGRVRPPPDAARCSPVQRGGSYNLGRGWFCWY